MKWTHLDLFSGIGGFSLAVDRVWPGAEHTFCEIDPFCQEVLKNHWPNSKIYGDIRTLTNTRSEEPRGLPDLSQQSLSAFGQCDLLTGGFPCQPFSQAGVRRGTNDDRHLWPEMLRVISEFRPQWVVAENVAGLLSIEGGMVFEQVCTDLEREGYEVWPFVIPACGVGAPHRRDRVWFVAHGQSEFGDAPRLPKRESKKNTRPRKSDENDGRNASWNQNWLEVATRLCRVDDGLPRRLDRNPRLKALGNAIVPQVAEEIFKAIREVESPLPQ